MPYVPYDLTGLATITDVAAAADTDVANVWRWIKETKLLPSPTVHVGNRWYYKQSEVAELVAKIKQIKEGRMN